MAYGFISEDNGLVCWVSIRSIQGQFPLQIMVIYGKIFVWLGGSNRDNQQKWLTRKHMFLCLVVFGHLD